MKPTSQHTPAKAPIAPSKQRSYGEITDYLDANWQRTDDSRSFDQLKQLDQAFGALSQKVSTIFVSGTNGKSLTTHFATKLLKEEGLSVGAFYAPHILTYNERITLNNEAISNKLFTDLGNEVINAAEHIGLEINSLGLLTMMMLLYCGNNKVDVAIVEVDESRTLHPFTICQPKIIAITRVTDETDGISAAPKKAIERTMANIKPGTIVVCADQSKLNLQIIQQHVEKIGASWAMPIRKLAPLSYPFEQLHGRCAALAERMAHIYVNEVENAETARPNSLLARQKGQRGRPTLEAKRQSELNPRKTVEQFWKENENTLPGRFQMLEREKPIILLDTASNLDAYRNLLLGVRLLHYQRSLKGLSIIMGSNDERLDMPEFLKLLRYFFKKTSGQLIICKTEPLPGQRPGKSWDVDKVINDIKSMKIKAIATQTFTEAFEAAQAVVDERQGLIVITGSPAMVSKYWQYKGIKRI